MEGIIEARNLPENDKVYLRKGMFGYRVVHPCKNEDGKVNKVNLIVGGWGNFFILIFILLILLSLFAGVKQMLSSCKDMSENPCKYFGSLECVSSSVKNPMGDYGLVMIPNYSNIPKE